MKLLITRFKPRANLQIDTKNFVLHRCFLFFQAQRLSDDALSLCFANDRLKAELIPLSYHHNLTGMRMGVGAKR